MTQGQQKQTLGTYLRDARARAGLSIRELERLTGVANSYLTKLELNQKTNPSAEVLLKLAEVLELDPSEVLRFIGIAPPRIIPSMEVVFRSKYGLSEAEAKEAAALIEARYGTRQQVMEGGDNDSKQSPGTANP